MFEPDEESIVLEIICGVLDIKPDEMMKIGDKAKEMLFDPSVKSEEIALERLNEALEDMSKEHALVAGVFVSGLLRCNLAQHCMQAMAESEGCQDAD